MKAALNIVLIGMPACGKSTLGVQLAKWLSKEFIDTDLRVQARAGCSMQAFQNRHGLESYQRLECKVVGSLTFENCVIATGGSVVYCAKAMHDLRERAQVVFLDVPLDEIKNRIGDISERGVVIRPGMALDDLYAERRPMYRSYADLIIHCTCKTPVDLLEEIRARIGVSVL